jgi:hypothetical protein
MSSRLNPPSNFQLPPHDFYSVFSNDQHQRYMSTRRGRHEQAAIDWHLISEDQGKALNGRSFRLEDSPGRFDRDNEPRSWSAESPGSSAMRPEQQTDAGLSRRDAQSLAEQAIQLIKNHPDLSNSQVEVSVTGNLLTLNGFVPDHYTGQLAAEIVTNVRGVTQVQNQLTIKLPAVGFTQGNRPGFGVESLPA